MRHLCETCGETFVVTDRRKRYCSRSCAGRAHGRGGFYIAPNGRAFVRDRNGEKVPFARCLMEGHLRRKLRSGEHVHHVNGDCADDRIENLEIVTASEHFRLHVDEIREAITRNGKLSAEQVAYIKASTERTSVLARRFGVTEGAIVYHRGALLKAHGRA